MHKTLILVTVSVALLSPAWASSPGQPLDCSDWVFAESGLACTQFVAPGELTQDSPMVYKGVSKVVDNQGRLLFLRESPPLSSETSCPIALQRLELVARSAQGEAVLAFIEDRQYAGGGRDHLRAWDPSDYNKKFGVWDSIGFDPTNGVLFIPVNTACTTVDNCNCVVPYPPGTAGWSVIAIEGFATTFEILQTYTPTANAFQFRVPYMPEGFQAADHFDTYAGNLTRPIDFSQAQPLQCHYPSSAPTVGDYFTVADTLPTPTPGHGYYYVTAVTYQGQTGYGRKRIGGVTSGRDPAVLPGCRE